MVKNQENAFYGDSVRTIRVSSTSTLRLRHSYGGAVISESLKVSVTETKSTSFESHLVERPGLHIFFRNQLEIENATNLCR